MKPTQSEEVLLGVIIKNNDTDIPMRVVRELHVNKFIKPEHKKIYSAIVDLVTQGKPPDPTNLNIKLNGSSEGGYEYLLSLVNLPEALNINSNGSLESLVNEVDRIGMLWAIRELHQKGSRKTEDFDKLCSEIDDPTSLIGEIGRDLKDYETPKVKSKHVSIAVDKALTIFDQSVNGFITDIIYCGFRQFSASRIPRPKSVGVILGFPSTGKTSLALQILLGAAYELKRNSLPGRVYFQSLDTTEENMGKLMGCMLARIDSMVDPKDLSLTQKNRFRTCLEWVKTLPIYYNDNLLTSEEMKREAIWSSYESPRVLNISDYAEKFADRNKESEELRMSRIIHNHREVAWETGSCEILLSQPGPDAVKDPSKIATLSDARYTKSFEQVADWGLVIWNPPAMTDRNIKYQLPKNRRDDQAVIFVQKNKGYKPTETHFEWIGQYSMFRDPSLPMNHFWDSEPWQFVEPEW